MSRRRPRLLAVASAGGHWVELRRLRPAFEGCDVHYVTTDGGYRAELDGDPLHVVPDASRWSRVRLAWMVVRVAIVVLRVRPDVVISTGAAPGYFALRFGRLLGARTLWLDSIANVEELSMSGARVGRFADLWLTQWPELARPGGPEYAGAVL